MPEGRRLQQHLLRHDGLPRRPRNRRSGDARGCAGAGVLARLHAPAPPFRIRRRPVLAPGAIARPAHEAREYRGILAWLLTTDHKKSGIMYLIFTITFLFSGGVL